MAEWLRRLTRNEFPFGSVGSNPTNCENFRCFHQIAIPREISGYQMTNKGLAYQVRPCGLMDKAPDFGSGDCRFESCHGRINKFLTVIRSKYLAPGEARTHNPGISLCTVYKYRALTDCATGANCLGYKKFRATGSLDIKLNFARCGVRTHAILRL